MFEKAITGPTSRTGKGGKHSSSGNRERRTNRAARCHSYAGEHYSCITALMRLVKRLEKTRISRTGIKKFECTICKRMVPTRTIVKSELGNYGPCCEAKALLR